MIKQPQLADNCDWNKLDGELWVELLIKQPQLADKCDWNKLDGKLWVALLCELPQFADKCNWEKLDGNGDNWRTLLCAQPQFADKCNWDKQDAIIDKKILQEYKNMIIAFLTDFTKLDTSQFDNLSIINAKNYYEYRLLVDNTAISRCFKPYTERTENKDFFSGKELDKSCLWRVRTDLLQDVEKLKAEGDTDFNIILSDCVSVIECTNCKEEELCPKCDGTGKIEWLSPSSVPCPRCSHLINPGWIGSRVCDLCGNKSHLAKKIYYKGNKYRQRNEDYVDIFWEDGGSGYLHIYETRNCFACDGTGRKKCSKCGGNGKLETGWKIEQQLIEHKKSTKKIWLEQLPNDLEEIFYKNKLSSNISTMSLLKKWESNSGTIDSFLDDDLEIKEFKKTRTDNLKNALAIYRKSMWDDEYDYLIKKECIELYRKPVFTKIIFNYLEQKYCVWINYNDKTQIFDFENDGFSSVWKIAKTKFLESIDKTTKDFTTGMNYLKLMSVNTIIEECGKMPNKLHHYVINNQTIKESSIKTAKDTKKQAKKSPKKAQENEKIPTRDDEEIMTRLKNFRFG